jgi:hypothetical protein
MTRKERRDAAKKMGYLNQKTTFKDFADRIGRSNKAGDMIHKKHLEEQRWELKKKEEMKKYESSLKEIQEKQETQEFYNFDASSFGFLNPESGDEDLPQ